MSLRFINGFIEIDYEPVAKILDGKDWKTVQHDIESAFEDEHCGTEDQYNQGFEAGKDEGEEEENARFNREIDNALEQAVKDGIITREQCDQLCEVMPS